MSKVYLVGAGPGDPELITVKGRRVLENADVILYDHLAPEALLDVAPAPAQRIYVGKKRTERAYPQEEIIAMMVRFAREGKTVVRLKGGDPYIFGRGGEEAEALADAGVEFEVVPGVTAPLGIAAYAGVPLTHREHTSVVSFVTGHSLDAVDWSRYGPSETLVIFMGIHHAADIMQALMRAGRAPSTPAIAVRWGTRPDQVSVVGTVGDLAEKIRQAELTPPATIIVGDVVGLHHKLAWFERLPLFGQRVVVTRAKLQAGELVAELRAAGAEPIEAPAIEISPVRSAQLETALDSLERFDWVVFTSANAVEHFFAALHERQWDARRIRGRVCAIGAATAERLRQYGVSADLLPQQSTGEGMAAAFAPQPMRGARVLIPRAEQAREVIADELERMGAEVTCVTVYRTTAPADLRERAQRALARHPHWIVFTSPSTVNNFVEVTGVQELAGVRIAVIGPTTAAAVQRLGMRVDAEAASPTPEALIQAMGQEVRKASVE